MRTPDLMKDSVCFLSIEESGQAKYGGTAFFIRIAVETSVFDYLVTARHCVERAASRGSRLSCRVNTDEGSTRAIPLPEKDEWTLSETADIAVVRFEDHHDLQISLIPGVMFLTDDQIIKEGIGIGDELFLMGLFTQRQGTLRNIPIIRSGIIAAMPEEPIFNESTGQTYNAYLIEARSIGGLSGSPVFMAYPKRGIQMHPPPRGFNFMTHEMVLLGVVRGHWDLKSKASSSDFLGDEDSRLNMGIAIVTPIEELTQLLKTERLILERRQKLQDVLSELSDESKDSTAN